MESGKPSLLSGLSAGGGDEAGVLLFGLSTSETTDGAITMVAAIAGRIPGRQYSERAASKQRWQSLKNNAFAHALQRFVVQTDGS